MASDEPELPEGWTEHMKGYHHEGGWWLGRHHSPTEIEVQHGVREYVILPISVLRSLLSAHGLHIVDAKDWAVLEASGAVSQRWLESYVNIIVPTQADPQAFAWAKAELARREKA